MGQHIRVIVKRRAEIDVPKLALALLELVASLPPEVKNKVLDADPAGEQANGEDVAS